MKEVKVSLLIDDKMVYISHLKNCTRETLHLIKNFSEVTACKIKFKKVALICTNNKQSEKEIRETIPFTIATDNIK